MLLTLRYIWIRSILIFLRRSFRWSLGGTYYARLPQRRLCAVVAVLRASNPKALVCCGWGCRWRYVLRAFVCRTQHQRAPGRHVQRQPHRLLHRPDRQSLTAGIHVWPASHVSLGIHVGPPAFLPCTLDRDLSVWAAYTLDGVPEMAMYTRTNHVFEEVNTMSLRG